MRALVLFLAASCGSYDALPRQDEATVIVWQKVYGEQGRAPDVQWIEDLDCADEKGFIAGRWYGEPKPSGNCVYGVSWPDWDLVQVAIKARFSEGAFAHELYHQHLDNLSGFADPKHLDPGFRPGGTVDLANAALNEVGL